MNKIHIITGQTATGKTKAAIEYAAEHNGEVINFDSRQIYKNLDIVTGKDVIGSGFTKVSTYNGFDIGYYTVLWNNKEIRIWLYDIVSPDIKFSSFDFESLAIHIMKELFEQKKVPVFVGGTYLYIYFLLYGESYDEPDWAFRKKLENKTVTELQEMLKAKDRSMLSRMNDSDKRNPHRLIRALERKDISGEMKFDFTIFNKLKIDKNKLDITFEGMRYKDKEFLHKNLEARVNKRIDEGAIEEYKSIIAEGVSADAPGLQSIGYSQIAEFVNGKIAYNELIEKWIIAERKYAKRQLTFIKRDPHIVWRYI